MKAIICSKSTKNIIWILLLLTLGIDWYILLFIGIGNTYIDEACFAFEVLLLILQVVRSVIKHVVYLKD